MADYVEQKDGGLILKIVVAPRSASCAFAGVIDGRLKVKLTSPPVDGKANEELVKFLSKTLKIPKSSIEITKGETSKKKTLLLKSVLIIDFLSTINIH